MRNILLMAGVIGLLALSSTAYAGFIPPGHIPDFQIRINDHGGGPPEHVNPPGLEHAPGLYRYNGHREKANRWKVEWDLQVDPDPLITGVFTVTNLSNAPQSFSLTSVLPLLSPITGGTLTGGAISGSLVDVGGGAELTVLPGSNPPSIYTAQIDDVDFQTLLDAPISITAPEFLSVNFGPESFGGPVPTLAGPDVLSSIAIDYNFRLSGGDVVVLAGTFVVEPIPEPSTIVLLCMAGLGLVAYAWRRR